MHTKDKLAAELRASGLTGMADKAADGYYHDFLSPLVTPTLQLLADLDSVGTPAATALRARAVAGEFDASKEEGDHWAGSQEGRATFEKLAGQRNRAERRAAGERGKPARPERLGDAPVQEEYRQQMNALAAAIDELFNGEAKGPDKKTGFVLLVFPFGDAEGGRTNFISNGADRKDIVTLFKEMIGRFEGQPELKGNA